MVKPVVIFDATMVSNKPNGISNDSSQILDALTALPFTVKAIRFKDQSMLTNHSHIMSNSKKISNLKYLIGIPQASNDPGSLFFQNQLNALQPKLNMPIVVRVHDLFPVSHPEWFRKRSRYIFRRRLKSLNNETFFICNSKYTAGELLKFGNFDKDRIFVLPCLSTIESVSSCGICSGCLREDIREYALAVGTIEPRKNLSFLISAWKNLNKAEFNRELVIVGRYGWKQRLIRRELQNGAKNQITWLSDVCDGAIRKLMRNSKFFVSASLDEGFNIPASEACKLGAKLVLSNIPVHHEFHTKANFFSLKNTIELQDLMVKLFESHKTENVSHTSNSLLQAIERESFQKELKAILETILEK